MGRQLVEGLPPSRLPLQAARAQFCRESLGASIESIAGLSSTKGHLEPLPHRYPTQGHTYTLTSASHWLSGYALEDIHSLVFLAVVCSGGLKSPEKAFRQVESAWPEGCGQGTLSDYST